MNHISLEDLLARVALADRRAFDPLYTRTSAKLFGVCVRILNDTQDAEDALHETYVKIWRNADRYARSRASAIAWMCAIARNASIDRLRARKGGHDDIDAAEHVADESPSALANVETEDDKRVLMACLDTLEDPKAAAIRAAFLSGLTYAELAERMNAPLGTVKSWIRRGLQQLKSCLEGGGVER
ncbi:MAG: sigma-70 family RNA polymerase sigma factor [Maricaulaceae bacterium]|jgi:RNA polymerase sigma-70 factor (ECF subfamily)